MVARLQPTYLNKIGKNGKNRMATLPFSFFFLPNFMM
jgi:hypothetical protein